MHIDINKLSEQTADFLRLSGNHNVDIPQYIKELRHVLKQHNYLYYVTANPIISDIEYDQIFSLLLEREAHSPELIIPESPTQQLSGQLLEGFTQAQHLGVMQSLQNTYNAEEVFHRYEGVARLVAKETDASWSYLVEPKFDGMSVEIVYAYGKFMRAVTRGDGKIGEEITEHAKLLHGLPLYIKQIKHIKTLSLRGEIVMPKTAFERLGTVETTSGGLEFANPRNATAGTLRHLNPQLVKKRGLTLEVYDLIFSSEPLPVATAQELRNLFAVRGIQTHPWVQMFSTIEEVVTFCVSAETLKHSYQQDIQLDGLVVKVNELPIRELIGVTTHHPKWAIAYKFPAEQVTTQIEAVSFQVGRTGVLTPVAHLTPVQIGGVTVQRATLHNREFIQKRDLRLHDRVVVQRSGEVIPYIVSVVTERRSGNEDLVEQPHCCPVCQHEVYLDEEGGSLRCINVSCTAQIKQRLQHFASKACLDIGGLGPRLVDVCVDAGLLHTLPDIYQLTMPANKQLLLTLPGVGAKKVSSLEKELQDARYQSLGKVFFGLSIRHVGVVIAQEITKAYHQAYKVDQRGKESFLIFCSQQDYLLEISGVGPQIATSIVHFFEDMTNRETFASLDALEVIEWSGKTTNQLNSSIADKHIVLTGTLPVGRIDLTNLLQQQGAKVVGSVSTQTDIVIVGEHPGSKLNTAQELGISTMSLKDFCQTFGVDISGLFSFSPSPQKEVSQKGLFG